MVICYISLDLIFQTQPPKKKVNGYFSRNISIPSDVLQGGHISPLLFNLYLYGISLVFEYSKFSLFLGELKLYYTLNSTENYKKIVLTFEISVFIMAFKSVLCCFITLYRKKSPINDKL